MPKTIEYPRASFKNSLTLADAVSYLGGSCSIQTCADKMELKVGGSFQALYGSAQKFKLITANKGIFTNTELYKLIKHSYNEDEMFTNKTKAFLSPIVFAKLYSKFSGKELPIKMLDKILIREFEVDQDIASRVAKYFVDGCKELSLLGTGNLLIDKFHTESNEEIENEEIKNIPTSNAIPNSNTTLNHPTSLSIPATILNNSHSEYSVQILGPGVDFKLIIREGEDILLVDAMLKKVKRKIDEIERQVIQ